MKREPTIQDVLDVLHTFSTSVDGELRHMRASMVTKDYLDNKLADLRGDLVAIARKGNTKFSSLIDELVDSKQMDQKVAARLLAMEPFPRT